MPRLRVEIFTDDAECLFSEWVGIPETEAELIPASALMEATSLALFQLRQREL